LGQIAPVLFCSELQKVISNVKEKAKWHFKEEMMASRGRCFKETGSAQNAVQISRSFRSNQILLAQANSSVETAIGRIAQ